MKKEAVGKIQPIKKSNNNLILAIIIIVLFLLVLFVLAYYAYDYFKKLPPRGNETAPPGSYVNDTTPINGSNINDTLRPKNDVCGDGKCTGKENYTNCAKDCKKTGPGGGGGGDTCTPNCAGKSCGSNGCGGTCGTCNAGYECNSTFKCALIACTNDYGCNSSGISCSGNMPYNCTNTDLDICLERINLTACSSGWQCMNGSAAGCEEIKNCTEAAVASDCSSFFNDCSYGICNSTGKCEIRFNQTGLCRAASGACGAAETCSGNSAACPADANSSGNICRASTGVCDSAAKCTGVSAACPSNPFNLTSDVCRNNVSECDAKEFCLGNNAICPIDSNKSNGDPCSLGTCQAGRCTTTCTDTCISLGYECGNQLVCQQTANCGTCTSGTCQNGRCIVSECNYYVSTTGSDSNSGTIDKPFATVNKAAYNGVLKPGDTLCIRGGSYHQTVYATNSGNSTDYITITSYPGETAIFDGEYTIPSSQGTPLILLKGDYMALNNLIVKRSYYTGVTAIGNYNIISNVKAFESMDGGLIAIGNYTLIENSESGWNCLSNVNMTRTRGTWGAGLTAARHPYYAILRNNTIHDNWGEGLSTFEAEYTLLEGNTIYDNQANVYLSDTQHSILRNNLIYCTPGNPIYPYYTQIGILLGDEMFNPPSYGNKVYNNLIVGCKRNLQVSDTALNNTFIAYNTFVNALKDYNVFFTGDSSSKGNVTFNNNLILQENNLPVINSLQVTGITFSNNLWSKTPPAAASGAGDVIGDPKLLKTGKIAPGQLTPEYFKFTSDSPAIDKASISEVKEDFFKNSRGSSPDMGAYEYQGGQAKSMFISYWPFAIDSSSDSTWQTYKTEIINLSDIGFTHAGITVYYLQTLYGDNWIPLSKVQNRLAELRALGINFCFERPGDSETYAGHEEIRKGLDPQTHASNGLNYKYLDSPGLRIDGSCTSQYSPNVIDPSYKGALWNHTLENLNNISKAVGLTNNDIFYIDLELWNHPEDIENGYCYPDWKYAVRNSTRCGDNPTPNPNNISTIAYQNYIYHWKNKGLEMKQAIKDVAPNARVIFHAEYPESKFNLKYGYVPPNTGDLIDPTFYYLPNLTHTSRQINEMNLTGSAATITFSYSYWIQSGKKYESYNTFDPVISQKLGYMLREAGVIGIYEWPGPDTYTYNQLKALGKFNTYDEFLNYYNKHAQALVKGFRDGIDPGVLTEICSDGMDNDGDAIVDNNDSDCVLAGSFKFENKRLNISTSTMDLGIEGGAIVYIKDKTSGEILINTSPWTNRPTFSGGFVPTQTTPVAFEQLSSNKGRLTYTLSLGNNLLIDATIEDSGEVIINLTGTGSSVSRSIDLPIMNFQKQSAILGSGAKYVRSDPSFTDYANYYGYGISAPNMVVLEGTNSVLSAWPEATYYNSVENIQLQHNAAYDHAILITKQNPNNTNSQLIKSSPLRIGTYPTWVKAAKRWKIRFEERTGAKPLWENPTPWVRNIHAVYYPRGETDSSDYSTLSSMVAPSKLLMFMWNGDRIVLFGDHTYAIKITLPTPEVLQIIRQNGWPLVLYHPYNLLHSDNGTTTRLNFLSQQGWLPPGYQFNPDYEGTPENWSNYWSDVKVHYSEDEHDLIHSGSTKYKNYLVRNFGNYCNIHKCNGSYFDTLGANAGEELFAPQGKKIVDGQDFIVGEESAIKNMLEKRPDLAIMSEYQAPWLLHLSFYTWESTKTHIDQQVYTHSKLNHPLRAALTGSYSWMKELNEPSYSDDKMNALLGTLPQISLRGDLSVVDARADWSQARGKLFCDEELFSDLPDTWDSDALAYYKSQRTGNWFKAIINNGNFQYIEKFSDGKQTIRLSNNSINTRVCNEGAITQTCFCGMASYSSGYCCNHEWKSTSCTVTSSELMLRSDTSLSSRIIDFFKSIFTGNTIKDITGYFIKS